MPSPKDAPSTKDTVWFELTLAEAATAVAPASKQAKFERSATAAKTLVLNNINIKIIFFILFSVDTVSKFVGLISHVFKTTALILRHCTQYQYESKDVSFLTLVIV